MTEDAAAHLAHVASSKQHMPSGRGRWSLPPPPSQHPACESVHPGLRRWDLVKLESGELPSAAVPPLSNGGTSHPLPGPPAQADQQLSPRAPSRSPSGHESPVTPPPDALEPTGAGLHDEGQGAMLGEPLPPLPPEAEPAPPLPQDSDDLPSVDEGPADAGELWSMPDKAHGWLGGLLKRC